MYLLSAHFISFQFQIEHLLVCSLRQQRKYNIYLKSCDAYMIKSVSTVTGIFNQLQLINLNSVSSL